MSNYKEVDRIDAEWLKAVKPKYKAPVVEDENKAACDALTVAHELVYQAQINGDQLTATQHQHTITSMLYQALVDTRRDLQTMTDKIIELESNVEISERDRFVDETMHEIENGLLINGQVTIH